MLVQEWYAILTKPGREAAANTALRRKRLTTFFPRDKVRQIYKRRGLPITRWVEKPHFSRYPFVRSTLAGLAPAYATKHVSKVLSYVMQSDDDDEVTRWPLQIPDQVMNVLLAGADSTGLMLPKEVAKARRFQAAQLVTHITGPLAGVLARVVVDDGKEHIDLLMNILGRETRVTARADQLVAA
jgi:transcription antitermination factor NusG